MLPQSSPRPPAPLPPHAVFRSDTPVDDAPPFDRRGSSAPVWLGAAIMLAVACLAWWRFGPGFVMAGPWITDWDRGIDAAEKSGKPLLVLFTADWCPPCRTLKDEVLSKPGVMSRLRADFTLVKVDLTDRAGPNNRIAMDYGVRAVPCLIMFNARGEQVGRLVGVQSAEHLLLWVDAGRTGR